MKLIRLVYSNNLIYKITSMSYTTFAELCDMATAPRVNNKSGYLGRVGRREKADYATDNRFNTFVCVLIISHLL